MHIRHWDVPDPATRSIGLWINGIGRAASDRVALGTSKRKERTNFDYQLLYIAGGEHQLVFDRETVTLTQREGIFISPDVAFKSYATDDGPWENYWVHFEGPVAQALVSIMRGSSEKPYVRYRGSHGETRQLDQMLAEYASKTPWYQAVAASHLHAYLTSLLRSRTVGMHGASDERSTQAGDLLMRCIQYMHEHFREDIRVQDIAGRLGYNRSHFTRLFTQYVGSSPREYIGRLRLSEAKHLLLSTDEPIGEIAKSLHYRNPDSFSKHFKKMVGISPYQFRTRQA